MNIQTQLTMMDMYRNFMSTRKTKAETDLVLKRNPKKPTGPEPVPDMKTGKRRHLPWNR